MPIPTDRTMDALATKPADKEERDLFINFMSALLDWLPEERFDSFKIFSHLWIHRQMEHRKRTGNGKLENGDEGSPL